MADCGPALIRYCLRLADNANVLSHRLCEWSGKAHVLEEDLALSNLGLDLLGQARSLYSYAAELEGLGKSEDDLAYLRDAHEFYNQLITELPNDDFAVTILRHFFFSAYYQPFFAALSASSDEALAAIAKKAEPELSYHLRHSAEWVIRLGDGTEESHQRVAQALQRLWSYTGELFEVDELDQQLIDAGVAVDPAQISVQWKNTVADVLQRATLELPPEDAWMHSGGRNGEHTEHLGFLLAEMQFLQRAYPGAQW